MTFRRLSAIRGSVRVFALTAVLTTTLTIPQSTLADTDLAIGSSAVIAYADGDNVRLRTGYSYDAGTISMLPEGTSVEPIDGPLTADDGSLWYEVWANGESGYVVADYLAASSGLFSGTSGTAITTDDVNLRSGPGLGESVVAALPAGASVTLTGDLANGWLSVRYDGSDGYIYGAFLARGDGTSPETASIATATGTRYTDDALNLRSGPSLESGVVSILPLGTAVEMTGGSDGDFVEVWTDAGTGWVAGQFLLDSPPGQSTSSESTPDSLIAWPIRGGTWSVLQGYNGSSHQNTSDLWQYRYSLDLVSDDGATAGQPVYSPVNGTIRWYDPSTGGVSIDMGNGYAFAIFHVEFDSGIPEGGTVSQGEYLGYISGPGGGGNGGTPHIHVAVWETSDGGNWSRQAVPFTGNLSLSGVSFPDNGSSFDHSGETVNP